MFSRDIFEELIPKIKLNKNRRNQNETSEMISPHCEPLENIVIHSIR
jgi:hypothetical protein